MKDNVNYRIIIWACVGLLVEGCWGLYFALADKATPIEPIVYTLACFTQPVVAITVLYSKSPVSLCWCLVTNAATYALVGLMVETLRKHLNHTT